MWHMQLNPKNKLISQFDIDIENAHSLGVLSFVVMFTYKIRRNEGLCM